MAVPTAIEIRNIPGGRSRRDSSQKIIAETHKIAAKTIGFVILSWSWQLIFLRCPMT
jgi:hypothetical protein